MVLTVLCSYHREARADPSATWSRHREFRKYLRLELQTLLNMFTEFPGLLAPKMQVSHQALFYIRAADGLPKLMPRFYNHRW